MRARCRSTDGLARRRAVAADEFRSSVDDHLRRVDAVDIETRSVHTLAIRQRRRRESILPAELIPVVHVQAERNDLYAGDRLRRRQLLQQDVRGRAAFAAFGREQLDDDRRRRRGRGTQRAERQGHEEQ